MLNSATLKAAQPRARAYKLFDGRGLHLHVLPSGRRSWRVKYRWQGAERTATLGAFPALSLPDARAQCDNIHDALERGEDPAALATNSLTFALAAERWIAHCRSRWSATHASDVTSSFERHVLPVIGSKPMSDIDAPAILQLLRSIEEQGSRTTARRLRQRISAVFALMISEGRATADPAAIVGRALQQPVAVQHHPALLDLAEARALLAACRNDASSGIAPVLASELLALTAVRLAAVRGMRWGEVEGIDFIPAGSNSRAIGIDAIWRVPAARMKLRADRKSDPANDHLVPLSQAAIAVLRQARANLHDPADDDLVFPGRNPSRPIGEGAIGALYVRAGFDGRHVPHGWRATFSTIMNERHREDRAEIDLALAHACKGKVEAAYNRAAMLSRRRWLLDQWADYLTG